MKKLLLISFLVAFTLAIPVSKDAGSDEYIDKVLENLRRVIIEENLDPLPLPSEEASFSETILGITFHGKARVYDGFFRGLSSIVRNGPTSFELLDNGQLKLTANVGLGRSSAGYSASASFMDIGVSASASADIAKVDCYLEAEMCLQPGCSLKLSKFEIKDIGDIDVDIDGLGPLGWILGLLTGLIADLIKGALYDVIEGPLRDLLQGLLDEYVPDIPSILLQIISNQ